MLLTGGQRLTAQGKPIANDVLISDLLKEVQKGLVEAQAQIKALSFPALKSVTLTLQTEVTVSGTAGVKILIFSFGKKWEREKAQQMTLLLRPPSGNQLNMVARPSVAQELVKAIVAAAKGVQDARSATPPLELSRFDASLSFVVTTESEGGIGFELVPVTPELKGNLKEKALHTITVTFQDTEEKS